MTAMANSHDPAVFPYRPEKNIFLTGFMGSGKSSVGKILAGMLGVEFFDTDELISGILRKSINDIFRCYGEAFFRNMETGILKLLGKKPQGACVVSTGGGAVLRAENIDAMRENGIIIYLDVSVEDTYSRLKETKDRPLLEVENLRQKIEELLQERKPYYLQADFSVNTTGKTFKEITAEIIDNLSAL
ncbi:MAG: shikimate kinase [Bacillota bacterium]